MRILGGGVMDRLRAVVCALFRHSRVVTVFFGYQYCGRCHATLGDVVGGVGARGVTSARHLREEPDCLKCRESGVRLTWFDWFLLRREARGLDV